MRIVAGLGNPGTEYARTRHNAGFVFVKQLAKEFTVKFKRIKRISYAEITGGWPEKIVLALPRTYMNRSGIAVKYLLNRFPVPRENMVVVYDDFDLPLGQIRIRKRGSAGSHKGLRSIIQELGTSEFPRIRIGIGPLPEKEDPAEFVLSSFSREERLLLEESLENAREALDEILRGNAEEAMNRFNMRQKNFIPHRNNAEK